MEVSTSDANLSHQLHKKPSGPILTSHVTCRVAKIEMNFTISHHNSNCEVYIRRVTSDQHEANSVLLRCCLPCSELQSGYLLAWTQVPWELQKLFLAHIASNPNFLISARDSHNSGKGISLEQRKRNLSNLNYWKVVCWKVTMTLKIFIWDFALICMHP